MANTALARVAAQPELDRIAKPLGETVVAAYRNAGSVGMAVKDATHPQPCFAVRERNGQIEIEPAR
jgi:hypothetical protein